MKRALVLFFVFAALALPTAASAFHHGGLPARFCAANAAGSPSNDNGQAKEALTAHNPNGLPLAPVGTPGQGKGHGEEHCANG